MKRERNVRPRSLSQNSTRWLRTQGGLAAGLGGLALVLALVGAFGPAQHVRTTYAWPPATLGSKKPSQFWYTPLLLARHTPDTVHARIPCDLPPALPNAARPVTVLATARVPSQLNGLAVTRSGSELRVSVGSDELTRIPLPKATRPSKDCAYDLSVGAASWSLDGGPDAKAQGGSLAAPPFVDGLFSALDLEAANRPAIEVTTAVHATRPSTRQKVAWILATLLALTALALVARLGRAKTPRRGLRLRSLARYVRLPDAVVAAALLGWWILSPAYYDDGWVMARQRTFAASHGFSNYYDTLGANFPLGYWFEWLEHWLTQSTNALLLLRIPALLSLAAIWILCRWILSRLAPPTRVFGDVALWALACGFLIGAVAWDMTVRPEPVIALLVVGVLACAVRFAERGTALPLALAALLGALAISEHPAGIVAAAPVLAVAPQLLDWARGRLAAFTALLLASGALLTVCVFLGSDVAQRKVDAQTARTFGDATSSWREEIDRYASLFGSPYATPVRRASVALMALVVLALVFRRRRSGRVLLDVPATTLLLALLLLIATPSKWAWHFGTLTGLSAAALAAETARLQADSRSGWSLRPFLAVGAAVLAAAWSWSPREAWNELDLRTLHWTLGIESRLTMAKLGSAVPIVVLLAAAAVALARNRRSLSTAPWRAACWTAPAVAVPALVFTVGVLFVDTVRTHPWTLGRQNAAFIVGRAGCGLADDALVARPDSMHPLQSVTRTASPIRASAPDAPGLEVSRFVLSTEGTGPASTPWFDFPRRGDVGMFVGSAPSSSQQLALEWAHSGGTGRIEPLQSDGIAVDFPQGTLGQLVSWKFLPRADLPQPPPKADLVRVVLRRVVAFGSTVALPSSSSGYVGGLGGASPIGKAPPGAEVAVTAPVTYRNEAFDERLRISDRSLVIPNLLTYLPCATQPLLEGGIVQPPQQVVGLSNALFPIFGRGVSPFEGVLDLYQLVELPLSDSKAPPGDVVVYDVDTRIPGAATAEPEATTSAS